SLSRLPSVFPDGSAVDRHVDQWLLVGLARRYMPMLKRGRYAEPALARLQALMVVGLCWVMTPAVLLLLGLRYLPRHDPTGTVLHMILFSISMGGALFFWGLTKATFVGEAKLFSAVKRVGRWRWIVAASAIAVVVVLVTGALEGDHPDYRYSYE